MFWDRLPEKNEYQAWVNKCQDGSLTVMDMGANFSQSEEHINLVRSVSSLPVLCHLPVMHVAVCVSFYVHVCNIILIDVFTLCFREWL